MQLEYIGNFMLLSFKKVMRNTFGSNFKLYRYKGDIYVKIGDYLVYLNNYSLYDTTEGNGLRLAIFPNFNKKNAIAELYLEDGDFEEIEYF